MISQEAIRKILGIKEEIPLTPEEMADKLNVTFYPYDQNNVSEETKNFRIQLEKTFARLKVNTVPYESSFVIVPLSKILRRLLLIILNNFIVKILQNFLLKLIHNKNGRIFS